MKQYYLHLLLHALCTCISFKYTYIAVRMVVYCCHCFVLHLLHYSSTSALYHVPYVFAMHAAVRKLFVMLYWYNDKDELK